MMQQCNFNYIFTALDLNPWSLSVCFSFLSRLGYTMSDGTPPRGVKTRERNTSPLNQILAQRLFKLRKITVPDFTKKMQSKSVGLISNGSLAIQKSVFHPLCCSTNFMKQTATSQLYPLLHVWAWFKGMIFAMTLAFFLRLPALRSAPKLHLFSAKWAAGVAGKGGRSWWCGRWCQGLLLPLYCTWVRKRLIYCLCRSFDQGHLNLLGACERLIWQADAAAPETSPVFYHEFFVLADQGVSCLFAAVNHCHHVCTNARVHETLL